MYVAQLHFTQTLTAKIAGELGVSSSWSLHKIMKKLINRIHSDVRLVAIFYGVISSLAATFIWNYSWAALTFFGNYSFGLLKGFIDSRYAKAATLEPTSYSYLLIIVLFIVISVGWIEISGKIKKQLNKTKDIDVEGSNKNSLETPAWASKAFLAIRIMVTFYLLNGLLYVAGEVTVLNAITDFNQHLRIITPYVTNEEKNKIISKWSQMRNLEDYNEVYKDLLKVANGNNLKLYRNRTY